MGSVDGVRGIRIAVDTIEHQRMQMNVQVRSRTEALDERDGAGGGLIAFLAGLLEEKRGNRAMDDLQYREETLGMDGKETARESGTTAPTGAPAPWG